MRNRVVRTVNVPATIAGQLDVRAEVVRSVAYVGRTAVTHVSYSVRYTVAAGELSADVAAFERQLLSGVNAAVTEVERHE